MIASGVGRSRGSFFDENILHMEMCEFHVCPYLSKEGFFEDQKQWTIKGAEMWVNSSSIEFYIAHTMVKTKIIIPADTQDNDI